MISASLQASELSAPLPRWAVGASLALIGVITAVLVLTLPPHGGADTSIASTLVALPRR